MIPQLFTWQGGSGISYKYWVCPVGVNFEDTAGNFIFAKKGPAGQWMPIYIGETDNLTSCLSSLEGMPCLEKYHCTHVHFHPNSSDPSIRQHEEKDLLAGWDPPGNRMADIRDTSRK